MSIVKLLNKNKSPLIMDEVSAQEYIAQWGGEIIGKFIGVSENEVVYVPNEHIDEVKKEIESAPPGSVITPSVESTVAPSEQGSAPVDVVDDRMKAIVEAVVKVFDKNDPDDFTSQGLPKASVLQELSGQASVSSIERQKALDIYNATR